MYRLNCCGTEQQKILAISTFIALFMLRDCLTKSVKLLLKNMIVFVKEIMVRNVVNSIFISNPKTSQL